MLLSDFHPSLVLVKTSKKLHDLLIRKQIFEPSEIYRVENFSKPPHRRQFFFDSSSNGNSNIIYELTYVRKEADEKRKRSKNKLKINYYW